MTVRRFDGPAPPKVHEEPCYPVLRPQKHGPLDLTLAGDTVLSVPTHYVTSDVSGESMTLACTIAEGECLYHHDRQEWSGWLPCYCHKLKRAAVLRLAPREYDALAGCLGIDLRWFGKRVEIIPTNKGGGRRVIVSRMTEHMRPADVTTFPIERTVCQTLKCARIPRPPVEVAEPDDVPFPLTRFGGMQGGDA